MGMKTLHPLRRPHLLHLIALQTLNSFSAPGDEWRGDSSPGAMQCLPSQKWSPDGAADSMSAIHPAPPACIEAAPKTLAPDEEQQPTEDGPFLRMVGRCKPWILTPSNWKQWLVFLAVWSSIIGGFAYLFIWGFPKLVDSVINPCIDRLQERLTPVQLGLLVIVGAWFFPVFIIPKDPFVWLAALVFPLPIALLLVEIADVLTITTTFWLGRTLLQKLALRFLNRYKRATAVLQAVKQAGQFKVVLLLSLGPIPKLATHYIISFPEDITFWPALAASFLGCLPGNTLGVVFGHNITGLSELLKGQKIPTAQLIYIIVSLSAAVIIVILFFWYARRALREIEADAAKREQEAKEAEAAAQMQVEVDKAQAEQRINTDHPPKQDNMTSAATQDVTDCPREAEPCPPRVEVGPDAAVLPIRYNPDAGAHKVGQDA